MNRSNMGVENPDEFKVGPFLKLDHVHLKVSNLKESINFYQSILGFGLLKVESSGNIAYLGVESIEKKISTLLVLEQIDQYGSMSSPSSKRREAGLYHFAILLPERRFLASFLRHIQENLDPQFYEGMADHAVSESIYLHDPDHNGIEVYTDRKPSEWKWINENKIYMVTEPLDVNNLLNQHKNEVWNGFPLNTIIGHVHLNVSNLGNAKRFYHQLLGLHHTASYPGADFFAANGYHHHVATNTWIGTNILQSSANDHTKPGLEHYAIRVTGDTEELNRLMSNLTENGVTINEHIENLNDQIESFFYIYDLDGIKIQILLSD